MIDPWDYTNLAHHYPWVRRFSYEEIVTFAYELSSFHPDDEQGREQCVREWEDSADILADPELARKLTEPIEDFGPAGWFIDEDPTSPYCGVKIPLSQQTLEWLERIRQWSEGR